MDSEAHRLVHTITAHLALYHSHNSTPKHGSARASILRWFSSLSPARRQAALTILDSSFILILFKMQHHLLLHGYAHFLILPDVPSTPSDPTVPYLSFRPSRGLIYRADASNSSVRILSDSLLFFSSVSSSSTLADALSVSESLVTDVDSFVGVMDGVSGGGFLCEEIDTSDLTVKWMELPWLKGMGHYSFEAFVTNRIEVALRLAWISSLGGKKPKDKKLKEWATDVSGKAANAFWRMKGCLDWWVGLDPGLRRVIISAFFGNASRALANEIIREENASLSNEFGLLNVERKMKSHYDGFSSWKKAKQKALFRSDADFGFSLYPVATSRAPSNLAIILNKLVVIQTISNVLLAWLSGEVETEKLFFGYLHSDFSVYDHITRKLQRFLMVFYTTLTNHELMEDAKQSFFPKQAEEKYCLVRRKGKCKSRSSKKLNAMPKANNTTISQQYSQEKSNARVSEGCKEHSSNRKNRRKGTNNKNSNVKNIEKPKHEDNKDNILPVAQERELRGTISFECTSNSQSEYVDVPRDSFLVPSISEISHEYAMMDITQSRKSIHKNQSSSFSNCRPAIVEECDTSSGKRIDELPYVSQLKKSEERLQSTYKNTTYLNNQAYPWMGARSGSSICSTNEIENVATDGRYRNLITSESIGLASKSFISTECSHASTDEVSSVLHNGGSECLPYSGVNSIGVTSNEWPSLTPIHYPSVKSRLLPATDRLHLDVGVRWPYNTSQSFMPSKALVGNSFNEFGHSGIMPLTFPMSYDWPLMIKNSSRLSQIYNKGYESTYNHSKQPSFYSGISSCVSHGVQINVPSGDNEVKRAEDIIDFYDMKNMSDLVEDESYWLSEEEYEPHARPGRDYNKFFGGGVMYWNPAELVGSGFSRPPSHSSEDSSWAWHEAELNRTIDDMLGCKNGLPAYSTNGISSPPSSTYCSPFDPMTIGHPPLGYSVAGNDGLSNAVQSASGSGLSDEKISSSTTSLTNGIEAVKGDPLMYPMLRPIIIPGMSRKGSRSDFKVGFDNKSPCLPSTRRDTPRIKRPPSPVVLCVPRVPRPPPPSTGESRKRGFPVVRSGSSSPRHWGAKNWYHEENTVADTHFRLDGAEVVWPTWVNKGLGMTAATQSLQGSLLQDHLITLSQLAIDQEHPDVVIPLRPPDLPNDLCKGSLSMMQNLLHEEVDSFCKQVAAENLIRKPFINWAVKRVTRSLQVLWPRSRTNIFGSNATGLALPSSDVDLVVSLPPVRNLEPIKEAGILEGRNGIKETCLQHAARYLGNQEWVRSDSLKTIENTAIPVIMLVAEVPCDLTLSHGCASIVDIPKGKPLKITGEDNNGLHLSMPSPKNEFSSNNSMIRDDDSAAGVKAIRLDISFKSASHMGLQTSDLVRELTQQFPASVPLALVLKKFLADRSLDHSYSGGLSSYCLVLLITRFLQHQHHCGYYMKQNLGSLLMDFFYFFGNVFDPRHMRISIQGSGVYMKRERGLSIDPIHIDDPLFPTNNVGRNCFRIHQCIKAFADAYSTLKGELTLMPNECDPCSTPSFSLLRKIVPSIVDGKD